jgi:hypothetical protein
VIASATIAALCFTVGTLYGLVDKPMFFAPIGDLLKAALGAIYHRRNALARLNIRTHDRTRDGEEKFDQRAPDFPAHRMPRDPQFPTELRPKIKNAFCVSDARIFRFSRQRRRREEVIVRVSAEPQSFQQREAITVNPRFVFEEKWPRVRF